MIGNCFSGERCDLWIFLFVELVSTPVRAKVHRYNGKVVSRNMILMYR